MSLIIKPLISYYRQLGYHVEDFGIFIIISRSSSYVMNRRACVSIRLMNQIVLVTRYIEGAIGTADSDQYDLCDDATIDAIDVLIARYCNL